MKIRRMFQSLLVCAILALTAGVAVACSGHTHDPVAHAEQAATCTEGGYAAYWTCGGCDGFFADAECTIETTLEELATPALGHSIQAVAAKEPTCTEDGCIAHYACERCGLLYSDAEGNTPLEEDDVILDKLLHINMEHVEAQVATEDEDGCIEHYYCPDCGKYFSDSFGDHELAESEVIFSIATVNLTLEAYDLQGEPTELPGTTEITLSSEVTEYILTLDELQSAKISPETYTLEIDGYGIVTVPITGSGDVSVTVVGTNFVKNNDPDRTIEHGETGETVKMDAPERITITSELDADGNVGQTVTFEAATSWWDNFCYQPKVVYKTDVTGTAIEVYATIKILAGLNDNLSRIGIQVAGDTYGVLFYPYCTGYTGPVVAISSGDNVTGELYPSTEEIPEWTREAMENDGLEVKVVRIGSYITVYAKDSDGNWVWLNQVYENSECPADEANKIAFVGAMGGWEISNVSVKELTYVEEVAPTVDEYGNIAHYENTEGICYTTRALAQSEEEFIIEKLQPVEGVTLTVQLRKEGVLSDYTGGTLTLTDAYGQQEELVFDGDTITIDLYTGVCTLENDEYYGTFTVEAGVTSYSIVLNYKFGVASGANPENVDLSHMADADPSITIDNADDECSFVTLNCGELGTSYYFEVNLVSNARLVKNFSEEIHVQVIDDEGTSGFFMWSALEENMHLGIYQVDQWDNRTTEPFDTWGENLSAYIENALISEEGLTVRIARDGGTIVFLLNWNGTWIKTMELSCTADAPAKIVISTVKANITFSKFAYSTLTYVEEQASTAEEYGVLAHYVDAENNLYNTDFLPTTMEELQIDKLISANIYLSGRKDGADVAFSDNDSFVLSAEGYDDVDAVFSGGAITADLMPNTAYTIIGNGYIGTFTTGTDAEYTVTLYYDLTVVSDDESVSVADTGSDALTVTIENSSSNIVLAELLNAEDLGTNYSITTTIKLNKLDEDWANQIFLGVGDSGTYHGFVVWLPSDNATVVALYQKGAVEGLEGWFDDLLQEQGTYIREALVGQGLEVRVTRNGGTISFEVKTADGTWLTLRTAECSADAGVEIVLGAKQVTGVEFSDIVITKNS